MATRFPRSWFWAVMILSLMYGLALWTKAVHDARTQANANSLEHQVSVFLKESAPSGPLITAPELWELNGVLRPGGLKGDNILSWLSENPNAGLRRVPESQRPEKTALILSERATVLSLCSVSEAGAVTIISPAREKVIKAVTVARFQDLTWDEYMDWKMAGIASVSAFFILAVLLLSNVWAFTYPHVGWRRVAILCSPALTVGLLALGLSSSGEPAKIAAICVAAFFLTAPTIITLRSLFCWVREGFSSPRT